MSVSIPKQLALAVGQSLASLWGFHTLEKVQECTRVPLATLQVCTLMVSILAGVTNGVKYTLGAMGPTHPRNLIGKGTVRDIYWTFGEVFLQLLGSLSGIYLGSLLYLWYHSCGDVFRWYDITFNILLGIMAALVGIWSLFFMTTNFRTWRRRIDSYLAFLAKRSIMKSFLDGFEANLGRVGIPHKQYHLLLRKLEMAGARRLTSLDLYQTEMLQSYICTRSQGHCAYCSEEICARDKAINLSCCPNILHWECARGFLVKWNPVCHFCKSNGWVETLRQTNLKFSQ